MTGAPIAIPRAQSRQLNLRTTADLPEKISALYLVKGLLAPYELSVLYGEPGSGKSFLALEMAYAVAQGRDVFGRRILGFPTLYLALEGERGFERRVAAIARRKGASPLFHFVTEPVDLFSGQGDAEAVIEAASAIHAPLIVIDTLARAIGCGSENDGADMGYMIGILDTIRRETAAHVMLVHHSGKDAARGMRGHSSLLAAVDAAIEVKRADDGTRTAKVVKSKDGIDGDSFAFRLDVVELGLDGDNEAITSCVVREEAEPAKGAVPLTPLEADWLKGLISIIADCGGDIIPTPGMPVVRGTARDRVRDGFRRQGRFVAEPHAPLTQADRSKVRDILGKLRMKGKIGMTESHIWLVTNA